MPTDILKKMFKMNNIQLATIKYLEDEKKEIIEILIANFFKKNEFYTKSLEKEKDSFKDSIIDGHFNWVIQNIDNPSKIPLNFYNESILEDYYDAYCDFYTEIINYFNTKKLPPEMLKIIIKQFTLVKEHYCSN